jgi:hypothetical protein
MYIERACYLLVLARTRAQDRIGVGAAPLPGAGPLVKYVAGRFREPRHENATRMKARGKRRIGDENANRWAYIMHQRGGSRIEREGEIYVPCRETEYGVGCRGI